MDGELESAKVPVTASFGIATLMAGATDLLMLLNRADEALYYAKQTGRNKTILWNPDIHNELT